MQNLAKSRRDARMFLCFLLELSDFTCKRLEITLEPAIILLDLWLARVVH